MSMNSPGSVPGASPIRPVSPTSASRPAGNSNPATESQPLSPRDEVEISSAGEMLDRLNQSSEIRAERLAQIRAAIEAGEYETPEKLEAALEKMLDEIDPRGDKS